MTFNENQHWKSQIHGKGGLISSLNIRIFLIKKLKNNLNSCSNENSGWSVFIHNPNQSRVLVLILSCPKYQADLNLLFQRHQTICMATISRLENKSCPQRVIIEIFLSDSTSERSNRYAPFFNSISIVYYFKVQNTIKK